MFGRTRLEGDAGGSGEPGGVTPPDENSARASGAMQVI